MGGLVREDETALLWDKLTFLAPFALLTTRHAAPVGTVRSEHREELTSVLDELELLAATVGVPAQASALLDRFDNAPEGMRSSMQRDAAASTARWRSRPSAAPCSARPTARAPRYRR